MKLISNIFKVLGQIWVGAWFLVFTASIIGNYLAGGIKEVVWALSPLNIFNFIIMFGTIAPAGLLFKLSGVYEKKYHQSILTVNDESLELNSTSGETRSSEQLTHVATTKIVEPNLIKSPPIISEQNMRPGNIIFASSTQFPRCLKLICSKIEPDDEIGNLNSSIKYSYTLKKEIVIKTGNIDLMAHDLDEMMGKYRLSDDSYCYLISKSNLKQILSSNKISFEESL